MNCWFFPGVQMSDRRLAAIMVTDLVGFTAMLGADQDKALQLLNRGNDLLKSIVAAHDGEWLEDSGDRSQSAFPSAIDAVRCALEVQSRTRTEAELNFRMGIDIGHVIGTGGHVYGEAVNVASLIERLADPNGMVITKAVYDAVAPELDLYAVDLGEKVLKNVVHPVRLYALKGTVRRLRLGSFASSLVARRVPQFLGAYLAASWAIVEVTEWLVEQRIFTRQWTYAVMAALLALLPSVLLIAYTHGAHGRDRFTRVERVGVPLNLLVAGAVMLFAHQNVAVVAGGGPIERASVAVLPFRSEDPTGEQFSRGLSDELVTALSKVRGLHVASRSSSFIFEGTNADARAVARDLRVATVLEGSVRRDGARIRVTAQLIDGANQFQLWTQTYERELADVFFIQQDIARAVARELVGVLRPGVVVADARAGTVEAYDFYLQGIGYLRQPPTANSLASARALLNRALEEDSAYARAHAALCEVELEQYVLDRSATPIDAARTECLHALALDNESSDARRALAVLYRYTGEFERSEQLFRDLLDEQMAPPVLVGLASTLEAQGELALAETYFLSAINLEPGNWHSWLALAEFYYVQCRYDEALGVLNDVVDLSPDNARAHLLMGASYFMDGNVDASLRETQRAIEIAPSRGAYRDLGLTHHTVGDYGAAVTAFMRALDLGPNDYWTWGSLGDTYAQITGRQDDALAAYRRASDLAEDLLARNPRDWRTLGLLAEYSVMIGNVDESIRRITTAVANAPRDFDVQISDVVIRSYLDQNEQALDALERAVELGCYPKRMIADDPRFSALRDDDRFKRIVSQSTEE